MFDDQGNIWPAGDDDPRRFSASDLPFYPSAHSANLEKGLVRLYPSVSGVRIELCSDRLSEAAFVSVMHWLADHPQTRVSLTLGPGTPDALIAGSPTEVKHRLTDCIQASRLRAAQRLRRAPVSPSALAKTSPLRIFRHLWQHGADPGDPGFAVACDQLFKGRYTLTEQTSSGDLVIRGHGDGYIAYSRAYLSRCVGLRIEDDPDLEYGLWNRDAYREAIREWRPLIEDIDATMRGAGEIARHVRYQRIIAPLTGRNGGTFLLSASVLASTTPIAPETR